MSTSEIGIACPALLNLVVTDFHLRELRKCQTTHLQPLGIRRKSLPWFVRRFFRRHNEHLIQAQAVNCRADKCNMLSMHRVERPTENPDPHSHVSFIVIYFSII